ncbi:hypothetical protein [Conexibacter sp. CPCC 206217]|uniref:hypothetical protein n=1 Tax=Conexibacter sp. CPCC 206217 TaxID=3064574 RepID=UPI002717C6CD|nr:hypothetical protein [Conexibacter sp. CPCC 206217]MDO8214058.1 hypothetical protein [Conexibacter sp. CPCC 206217]
MSPLRSDDGQATVELVALLPCVGLVIALLWQVALAGSAVWFSGGAARAAARADAVGGDALRAARGVLPGKLEHDLRIRRERDGGIALIVQIPFVLGDGQLTAITTRARFEDQR